MLTDTPLILDEPTIITGQQEVLGAAATRRMCTGVLTDREFRNEVLHEVYNDRSRRVAPSYGFDLIIVLHYAWRAWWLDFCQRSVLLAALTIELLRAPLATVIALSILALWYLFASLPELADKYTGYFYRGEGDDAEIRRIEFRRKYTGAAALACAVVLAAAMALSLSTSNRSGSTAAWPARIGLAEAMIIIVVWAAPVAVVELIRMLWIRQLRDEDPRPPRRLGRRMSIIRAQQEHPVTVHSGFRPFIGSGVNAVNWSFAQRLIHKKGLLSEPEVEFDVPPFEAVELMDCLRERISSLCTDRDPRKMLSGLKVADNLFLEGGHSEKFRPLLGKEMDEESRQFLMNLAIEHPSGPVRHYLACRVISWGGEIVTTVFVHVSVQGRALYLEFATHALLPTRVDYHLVDEPSKTGPAAIAKSVAKSVASLPAELAGAQHILSGPAQIWTAIRPRQDLTRRSRANARADIGAAKSARETAAIEAEESYFQYQDVLQHSKIIERRLIATVGDFLKKRNVDTTEFLERATAILNKGVINTGPGTVNMQGGVIGDQATVVNEAPPAAED